MARYPGAVWKPLTVPNRAATNSPVLMPSPVRVNFHTAVSNSYSLAWDETSGRQGYFNTTGAGGVFSHFYVRKDGTVEQMQDTKYRASCDLDGNPDTISIETWDGYKADRTGYPGYWKSDSDVPPLNPAQAEAMVDLLRWILATHPKIPAKLAVSNRRGTESHGFSYHRLGAPGYALYTQAEGGLLYTNSYKKGCPGTRKIGQMAGILAAATNQQEEDDMTPEQEQRIIDGTAAKVWAATFEAGETAAARLAKAATVTEQWLGKSGPTVAVALQSTHFAVAALNGQVAGLRDALTQVTGGSLDLAAVEAAAKRGVEAGLAGAQVVIDFPKEEQA